MKQLTQVILGIHEEVKNELIQAGLNNVPQGILAEVVFAHDSPALPLAYCAAGVIAYKSKNTELYNFLHGPVIYKCPTCDTGSDRPSADLYTILVHLNDTHDLDFIGIANKLDDCLAISKEG